MGQDNKERDHLPTAIMVQQIWLEKKDLIYCKVELDGEKQREA